MPHARRFFPALLILFAASGCSALIYEVTWYQLLQLAIGSTAVSMGVLLATFMGGLCIGSLALPRWQTFRTQHPLRVYAWLEGGIAAFGLLVLVTLPLINRVYVAGLASGFPGMLLRGLLAAACMLIPTILMGASLPALARWIEASTEGVSWWGLLYGGNTAGAVAGCLLAGFYLLRVYDTYVATYAAAALNVIVAVASFWMAARVPTSSGRAGRGEMADASSEVADSRWPIYATIAISGACALGAEVVWTRLMGMLLGATVYAFSILLAVFLVGLAAGSGVAALLLRSMHPRLMKARRALGWSQILAAFGLAWTAYAIADSLPYWPSDVLLSEKPVAALSAGYGAGDVGDSAGHAFLGRKFSARTGCGRVIRSQAGSRAHGRRGVRRQYAGRDRRSARRQPGAGAVDRHAEFGASAADRVHAGGADRASTRSAA